MSRPRIVVSVALVGVLLALTAGAAAVSFPLVGAPSVEPPAASSPAQTPVRIGGDIPPPKKIVDVRPVYPPDAREARVQGVVILEVTIAPDGTVDDVTVLRSVPMLDEAALKAVRQWVSTPTLLNGVAVPVIMTVTVNFTLDDAGHIKSAVGSALIQPVPKKIFNVKPIYPEEAKSHGIQGMVILQATIDESGQVSAVKVLRSIPALDQAAIDAVRQWRFEPPSKPVTMTTTINFSLDETKPADPGPGEPRSPGAGEFSFPKVPYPP